MENNTYKNKHGANGIESLKDMVESLKDMDYIVEATPNYRIADPQYGNKQFFFQYMIEFQNQDQWILHSTTTVRDRINAQQWHAEHIKRLNKYVEKAYVIVPDAMDDKEKATAEAYNENIQKKKIFSAIDGVVPFATAYNMIEKKATEMMSSGVAHAKLGLHFEQKLVDALNNQQNFEKWKNNDETAVGYLYELYVDVMKKLRIKKEEVICFVATSDIPKLPSGGTPKTDVLLEVRKEESTDYYTFSCKRSNSDWVSVHEYTADAFSTVLNPTDNELRDLLIDFQAVGGVKALGAEKEERLVQRLAPYADKLSKWVLGGIGGEGDEQKQWADYIVTLNDNSGDYSIHSVDEYIIECERRGVSGQLGTLFKWTYPSGGKGKRIQLKGKMI